MENSAPPIKDIVRVLVVDDHPNTAATLARALSQLGPDVDVISATSGHEALGKVRSKGVDILITDMIMPEMTGLELIEKLQNHPGGKPSFTYLVTAYDVPGLKVTAQRLKVNEVIVKPVRPERIYQITTQAINEMKHAAPPAKPNAGGKRKFKILVADDVQDNVALLSRYIEFEGYDQIVAKDGVEALNKIRDEMPDLVLLDVNMPHKDGFAVLEEVRADPAIAHIPVIILTAARMDSADVQSGLNLGADDYVTKPFDRHELMARIRTKLRVKESEDAMRRRNRELSLLPEIGKELSARNDVKDLANILLKRTTETLGAIYGQMSMLDASGNCNEYYQYQASSSAPRDRVNFAKKLVEHVKETHQGVIIKDTGNDPFWVPAANSPFHSAVVAPLFGRHELLGFLMLAHEQEKFFNLENLLLLQAIASQAAIAIENMRLHSNASQEQMLLDAVLMNSNEAILIFDHTGRLLRSNPNGRKMFPDQEMKAGEHLMLGSGYDAFVRMLERTRASKAVLSGEVMWPDQRTIFAHVAPINDGCQVAILHEVTKSVAG